MSRLIGGGGPVDDYDERPDLSPDPLDTDWHEYWAEWEDRDANSHPITEIPYRPKKETDNRG